MFIRFSSAIFCCVLLLLSSVLHSEQLSFHKDALSYSYHWHDQISDKKHQLQFVLKNNGFSLSKFKAFRPKKNQQYIEKKLRLHAKKYDPKVIRFSFIQMPETLQIKMQSSNSKLIDRLELEFAKLKIEAEKEFLFDNYYVYFTDTYNRKVVKPDYKRIYKESANTLLPVSNALVKLAEGHTQRYLMELILSFVQTIPYNRLESVGSTRGTGYIPPIQLLSQNSGDCDSKSVLMISLLKNIYPDLLIALILVPNHALLAVNIGARPDDEIVNLDGVNYVLFEPTGPAEMPLGKIADNSLIYVSGNNMRYEFF